MRVHQWREWGRCPPPIFSSLFHSLKPSRSVAPNLAVDSRCLQFYFSNKTVCPCVTPDRSQTTTQARASLPHRGLVESLRPDLLPALPNGGGFKSAEADATCRPGLWPLNAIGRPTGVGSILSALRPRLIDNRAGPARPILEIGLEFPTNSVNILTRLGKTRNVSPSAAACPALRSRPTAGMRVPLERYISILILKLYL